MELLQRIGLGPKFCSWILTLLRTASSSVLLNYSRGKWFQLERGLHQGDPLSPMLFIIAIDPLHKILAKPTQEGLLTPFSHRAAKLRISLYADDAAIILI